MRSALITNEKSPSVMMVSGSVRMVIIGRINMFMKESTRVSIKAPIIVTYTPGTRYAAITITTAATIQWKNI